MNSSFFEGPTLKLARARYHFEDMCKITDDYRKIAKPFFKKHERSIDPWQVDLSEPAPKVIALLVGDIAHSLRSALDLVLCDIARVRNVGTSDMCFPFADSEAAFQQKLLMPNKKQPFKKLGSDVVKIIEESQPYRGGDYFLRGLHDLNNQDKHKFCNPVVAIHHVEANTPEHHFDQMVREGDVNSWHGNFPIPLKTGWPIPEDWFRGHPGDTFKFKNDAIDFLFPEETVFGNQYVVKTIVDIFNVVSNLINKLIVLENKTE